MVPLIVHLASYFSMAGIRCLLTELPDNLKFLERAEMLSLGSMLLVTGSAHFSMTESMALMFPDFVPYKMELVYISGVFEILAAVAIFLGWRTKLIGVMLILFFLTALPLNIYSALADVGLGAKGISYLWFRVPLQAFWLWWVWNFFVISKPKFYFGPKKMA